MNKIFRKLFKVKTLAQISVVPPWHEIIFGNGDTFLGDTSDEQNKRTWQSKKEKN